MFGVGFGRDPRGSIEERHWECKNKTEQRFRLPRITRASRLRTRLQGLIALAECGNSS